MNDLSSRDCVPHNVGARLRRSQARGRQLWQTLRDRLLWRNGMEAAKGAGRICYLIALFQVRDGMETEMGPRVPVFHVVTQAALMTA